MAIVAESHPNAVAQELTGRGYLSFSAARTYASCPLRWYFRYIIGLPEETVSASLVFGGAIHSALEQHYRAKMLGEPTPTIEELIATHDHRFQDCPRAVEQ